MEKHYRLEIIKIHGNPSSSLAFNATSSTTSEIRPTLLYTVFQKNWHPFSFNK